MKRSVAAQTGQLSALHAEAEAETALFLNVSNVQKLFHFGL